MNWPQYMRGVRFCLSCSVCPVLPFLFYLSRLDVLFCLFRSGCPVLPVSFWMSCSACLVLGTHERERKLGTQMHEREKNWSANAKKTWSAGAQRQKREIWGPKKSAGGFRPEALRPIKTRAQFCQSQGIDRPPFPMYSTCLVIRSTESKILLLGGDTMSYSLKD